MDRLYMSKNTYFVERKKQSLSEKKGDWNKRGWKDSEGNTLIER